MQLKLLIIALLMVHLLAAQTPTVSWGEDIKVINDVTRIIPGEGRDNIMCGNSQLAAGYGLTRFDETLKQQLSSRLPSTGAYTNLLYTLNIGGSVYAFTCLRNGKDYNFLAQKVNGKTLQPTGSLIPLCAMTLSRKVSGDPTIDYMFSEDSSKFVLMVTAPNSDEDKERYSMAVCNQDMQLLWQRNVELPYNNKSAEKITFYVTNSGEVGVPVNVYDGKINDFDLHTEDMGLPAYSTTLFVYRNATAVQEIPVTATGKYLHTLQLVKDAGGKMLFGMYKNKSSGKITGYFLQPMADNATTLQVAQLNDFTPDLISQYDDFHLSSDRKANPGLSTLFYLKDVLHRSNGTTDYLIQYANGSSYQGTPEFRGTGGRSILSNPSITGYSFGDIIDIAVDNKGHTTITRIPRMIRTFDNWYGSILTTTYADKLLLFYVDDRATLQQAMDKKPEMLRDVLKSVFVMASIDGKGKLTRSVVFDSKTEGIATCVLVSKRDAANAFTLYALKGRGSWVYRVGKLEIK